MLPSVGLLLFVLVSYESLQKSHIQNHLYWWSGIALDTDPLHPEVAIPCKDKSNDCIGWDLRSTWVSPGLLPTVLLLSALPAFLLGMLLVRDLGYHGINEVASFMVVMPLFISVWFYLVGWLMDRWIYRRTIRHA
jgi:hypothetical protein